MTTNPIEFWPFPVSEADKQWPEMLEKIAFLEAIRTQGFQGYRLAVNNYGAKTDERSGVLIERGRTNWELRLAEAEVRKLTAYVSGFTAAATALQLWLEGFSLSSVLANLNDSLIKLPGATARE